MRNALVLLVVAGTTAIGVAQSPLTLNWNSGTSSFLGGNVGNIGNVVFFDLTIHTTVTFTRLDLNCGQDTNVTPPTPAVGTAGTVDVLLGPTTWIGSQTNSILWVPIDSASLVTLAPNQATQAVLANGFTLPPGAYGVCLRSHAFRHAYSNPVTGSQTSNSTAEMTITAGAAQNSPFLNPTLSPRLANVRLHYSRGGTPTVIAQQQEYGIGCYGRWTSFYEEHGNPLSWDLGTNLGAGVPGSGVDTVTLGLVTPGSGGMIYNVAAGGAVYAAPTSPAVPLAIGTSNFLASTALGGALPFLIVAPASNGLLSAADLEISTEGYITPTTFQGGGPQSNPADSSPTVAEFLGTSTAGPRPARWAPCWKNFDPILGGSMHVQVEAGTGALVVSWVNVRNDNTGGTGGTDTSSFQVAFHANGNVEYRYGQMSQQGGGARPIIAGWSQGSLSLPGPAALDRGSVDISALLPFPTDAIDNPPLAVTLDIRPVLGSSPSWVISGYPAGTALGARILGFTQVVPGLDLGGFGMGGCRRYVGLDDVGFFLTAPNSTSLPFIVGGIPNNPVFVDVVVFGQSATFSPGVNALGVLTSNGIRLRLGVL